MTAVLSPPEWFDQFRTYVNYVEPNWPPESHTWCPRHWAPAPCFNANGIQASYKLTRVFVEEHPEATTAGEMNEVIRNLGCPMCCSLGDQKIYAIWGTTLPANVYGFSAN